MSLQALKIMWNPKNYTYQTCYLTQLKKKIIKYYFKNHQNTRVNKSKIRLMQIMCATYSKKLGTLLINKQPLLKSFKKLKFKQEFIIA